MFYLFVLIVFEVVVVGVGGGYLAIWLGIPYLAFGLVSLLVYLAAGFFVGRAGGSGPVAGGAVALVESALWAAGVQVGPQPGPPPDANVVSILIGVSFTLAVGILFGALGARFAKRRQVEPEST